MNWQIRAAAHYKSFISHTNRSWDSENQAMTTPTTWPEWNTWVKQQRKRTPWSFVLQVLPNGHPKILEADRFYTATLDNMIRQYAKNPKRWPNMDNMERSVGLSF